MNYFISDLIIRIKNAAAARRKTVELPYSNMNKAIAKVLAKERFLTGVKEEEVEGRKMLIASIAYDNRIPVMTNVIVVSKPSLRVYIKSHDVHKKERKGLHTVILSTSAGVMSGVEAVKKGVGGELLFEIW